MSIADKLTEVAQNVPKVYEAGKKAQYDEFWDSFPANPDGTYLFSGDMWNDVTFKPKRNIVLKNGANGLFYNNACTNIKEALEKCGVTLDMSGVTGANQCFSYALTKELPALDLSSISNVQNFFAIAQNLETIESVRFKDGATFNNAFGTCKNLENITILGTISGKGFDVSSCTKMTKKSIKSIVDALSGTTSGLSITLSKTAVNNAFGINVDDETTFPEGSEYYTLRHSKDNWTVNYI